MQELQAYAASQGFEGELLWWDMSYWAERLKEARCALGAGGGGRAARLRGWLPAPRCLLHWSAQWAHYSSAAPLCFACLALTSDMGWAHSRAWPPKAECNAGACRYTITDEELRPFFALPNVLDGLFKVGRGGAGEVGGLCKSGVWRLSRGMCQASVGSAMVLLVLEGLFSSRAVRRGGVGGKDSRWKGRAVASITAAARPPPASPGPQRPLAPGLHILLRSWPPACLTWRWWPLTARRRSGMTTSASSSCSRMASQRPSSTWTPTQGAPGLLAAWAAGHFPSDIPWGAWGQWRARVALGAWWPGCWRGGRHSRGMLAMPALLARCVPPLMRSCPARHQRQAPPPRPDTHNSCAAGPLAPRRHQPCGPSAAPAGQRRSAAARGWPRWWGRAS
jgi:hypothetical protein